ncbi:thioredoxin domain-containing protein [Haloferax profundi]|uniref:Protein-disulfide isomerase n=1 Tax=Haloferax profundi TaxID=1544718 RepID=A0A0W1R5A1_9EURY|nr:thioredoxin domain-containing protein [Haloferax profundi]KTG08255.1 protein-disulfide isomerase [Haloferax profundi]
MRQTRRAYLAATAGALTLGTAGCLGGSGGSGSDDGSVAAVGCDVPERETVDSLPAPQMGPDDAAVVVEGWEDFACPHCATFSLEVLPKLESEYVSEGIVAYRHHDFPIPVDEWWSWVGASAARAVQDEADDAAFFDFSHTLYENQSTFRGSDDEEALSTLQDVADDAGLDGCSIVAAAARERYRPLVEAERKDAVEDRGFQGTPTVLVNGEQVAPRWEDLKTAIENAR